MLGNQVLRLRSRVAVKLNFLQYIRWYTSQNANFEYSYPQIDTTFTMEANTMYPDQTAALGTVWSGSIVFTI